MMFDPEAVRRATNEALAALDAAEAGGADARLRTRDALRSACELTQQLRRPPDFFDLYQGLVGSAIHAEYDEMRRNEVAFARFLTAELRLLVQVGVRRELANRLVRDVLDLLDHDAPLPDPEELKRALARLSGWVCRRSRLLADELGAARTPARTRIRPAIAGVALTATNLMAALQAGTELEVVSGLSIAVGVNLFTPALAEDWWWWPGTP